MIFVTVGHQTPFDRLIKAVDTWAGDTGRADVFAQIGCGAYLPQHCEYERFLSPIDFAAKLSDCSAVVGHAGTGTIMAAHEHGKPLLVLPRRADLDETRNEHQLATVKQFAEAGYILAATDEQDLPDKLTMIEAFTPRSTVSDQASATLISRLRTFIHGA